MLLFSELFQYLVYVTVGMGKRAEISGFVFGPIFFLPEDTIIGNFSYPEKNTVMCSQ